MTGEDKIKLMEEFEELMEEVVDASGSLTGAYEWGFGRVSAEHDLKKSKENLRKWVEKILKNIPG